jgi:hypothetical protein
MNLGGKEQIQNVAELYLETPGLVRKLLLQKKVWSKNF